MNTSAGKKRLGAAAAVLFAVVLLLAGCSDEAPDDSDPAGTTETAPGKAGAGPFFGECGGVTVEDVTKISKIPGLTNTVNNPSACEWVTAQDQLGPQLSFNWYRGSPIGRERATIQLSRDSVQDINIDGHPGFVGSSAGICEIGIEFGADFFEWSVSYGIPENGQTVPPVAEICATSKTLATQSIANAK